MVITIRHMNKSIDPLGRPPSRRVLAVLMMLMMALLRLFRRELLDLRVGQRFGRSHDERTNVAAPLASVAARLAHVAVERPVRVRRLLRDDLVALHLRDLVQEVVDGGVELRVVPVESRHRGVIDDDVGDDALLLNHPPVTRVRAEGRDGEPATVHE